MTASFRHHMTMREDVALHARPLGFDQHPREARVDRQPGDLAAQVRQPRRSAGFPATGSGTGARGRPDRAELEQQLA